MSLMAEAIPLNEACRQISVALNDFAHSVKGWPEDDYLLIVRASAWDSVHVLVAARAFRDEEGFAAREKEILEYLRNHVPDARRRIGAIHTVNLERYLSEGLGEHLGALFEPVGLG